MLNRRRHSRDLHPNEFTMHKSYKTTKETKCFEIEIDLEHKIQVLLL